MSAYQDLIQLSKQIRGKLVQISHEAKTPHLGSSLSCVDILVALYWDILNLDPKNPSDSNRDRLIFSKGHAASALYVALQLKGFFPKKILDDYAKPGAILSEHPVYKSVPGIESTSGSLGHGLPIGLGIALAAKIQNKDYKVFVLMSDGECNEGSVWEAAMLAPAQQLNNLFVIIDFNKWQATGRSEEVTSISSLTEKFSAFGWKAHDVDGHNIEEIINSIKSTSTTKVPTAIIAHTTKGKGVSFMEDDNNWHYRIPNEEELIKALSELKIK